MQLHHHVKRRLVVLAHVDSLLDRPELDGRLRQVKIDLFLLMAPVIILRRVHASADFKSQVPRDHVPELILKLELFLLQIRTKQREAVPVSKVLLALFVIAEILRGTLFGSDFLPHVPCLRRLLPIVVSTLDEQDLNVPLDILILKYRLHMVHVLLAQERTLVVQVLQDHEHLKLRIPVAHLARFIQIQQTLRILHVIAPIRQQLPHIQEHVPDDKATNED